MIKIEDRRTALKYTRVHEDAIFKIGSELSYSAMKVYMYLNFNCHLSSGVTHRVKYSEIAKYWGISWRSVWNGISELEKSGLITIKETGDFVGVIPHQSLIQQSATRLSYEKKEREFYLELQAMIDQLSENRKGELPVAIVNRIYERLVSERAKANTFYPKTEGFTHINERLQYYATSVD